MIFKYGDFAHEQNEVSLNYYLNPVMSPRGVRMATDIHMDIQGTIIRAGQADIKTRIQEIEAAYADDYKDAGLYHDDGTTPSPHFLTTAHPDNVTGNRITGRSFPMSYGAEYITQRSFGVRISARFRNAFSNILDFRETIQRVGTGGPRIIWREYPNSLPDWEQTNQYTLQHIVQTGYCVTMDSYFLPPPPVLDVPYYLQDRTVIENVGPTYQVQGSFGRTTRWTYYFAVPENTIVFPNER